MSIPTYQVEKLKPVGDLDLTELSENEGTLPKIRQRKPHSFDYLTALLFFKTDRMLHLKNLTQVQQWTRKVSQRLNSDSDRDYFFQREDQLVFQLKLMNIEHLKKDFDFRTIFFVTRTITRSLLTMFGEANSLHYSGLKLQVLMLQREKMYTSARKLSREIYRHHLERLTFEREKSTNDYHPRVWPRLLKMADQSIYLRDFEQALSHLEDAKQEIVLEPSDYDDDFDHLIEDKCGYLYCAEIKVIRLLTRMKRYDEALLSAKTLSDKQRALCGENHYSVLKIMHNMSVIYKYQGFLSEAYQLAELLMDKIQPKNWGFNEDKLYEYLTPKMYPHVELNMGELSFYLERPCLDVARKNLKKVVGNAQAKLGETHHPLLMEHLLNMGVWAVQKGEYGVAMGFLKGTYDDQVRIWGENDPDCLLTSKWMDECAHKMAAMSQNSTTWKCLIC